MQSILDKIFATRYRNKKNWIGAENFDNCFCVIFDYYCKRFISGRKTGHQAPPSFNLFLIFPNFLRPQMVCRLATREGTRLKTQKFAKTIAIVPSQFQQNANDGNDMSFLQYCSSNNYSKTGGFPILGCHNCEKVKLFLGRVISVLLFILQIMCSYLRCKKRSLEYIWSFSLSFCNSNQACSNFDPPQN